VRRKSQFGKWADKRDRFWGRKGRETHHSAASLVEDHKKKERKADKLLKTRRGAPLTRKARAKKKQKKEKSEVDLG